MGTQVSDGTASAPVTMDDLKELKESLTSSMTTEMKEMRELREMMTRFMAAQKADPPLPKESDADSATSRLKLMPRQRLQPKRQQKLLRIKGTMNKIAPLTLKGSLTTKRNPMCISQTHMSCTLR